MLPPFDAVYQNKLKNRSDTNCHSQTTAKTTLIMHASEEEEDVLFHASTKVF